MLGLERFRLLVFLVEPALEFWLDYHVLTRKCDSCKRCEGWIGLKASWAEIVGLRIERGEEEEPKGSDKTVPRSWIQEVSFQFKPPKTDRT